MNDQVSVETVLVTPEELPELVKAKIKQDQKDGHEVKVVTIVEESAE